MKITKQYCDYVNCGKEITEANVIHEGPSLGYFHEPFLEFCSKPCYLTYYQLAMVIDRHKHEEKMKPKNWIGMN